MGSLQDVELAGLVEFNWFEPRIRHWLTLSLYEIVSLKLVLGLSSFPDSDEKLFLLISNHAYNPENVAEIGMAALVKRPGEPNPGLNRNKPPFPAYLTVFQFWIHLSNDILFKPNLSKTLSELMILLCVSERGLSPTEKPIGRIGLGNMEIGSEIQSLSPSF